MTDVSATPDPSVPTPTSVDTTAVPVDTSTPASTSPSTPSGDATVSTPEPTPPASDPVATEPAPPVAPTPVVDEAEAARLAAYKEDWERHANGGPAPVLENGVPIEPWSVKPGEDLTAEGQIAELVDFLAAEFGHILGESETVVEKIKELLKGCVPADVPSPSPVEPPVVPTPPVN